MRRLIVDSREQRSGLHNELVALGAQTEVRELECGDYVLAEGLAVERKTAMDFVLSIENRRIFEQVGLMKATYPRPYFLVEGALFGTRSAMSEEALLGALSYISVIEAVPVLWSGSVPQSAKLLLTMQRHAIEGLGYEIALRGGKPKDRQLQAQFLLEGLPGVGPGAAKKLINHFGSAQRVLAAPLEELRAVAGIGPKTAATIREVLEYELPSAGKAR